MPHKSQIANSTSPVFCNRPSKTYTTVNIDATYSNV